MPRMPSAQDLGRRPAPSGQGGISRLQLTAPRRGLEAQAEVQFGKVIEGLGDTVAQIGFNEQKKIAGARIEEGYNQYATGLLEYEHGDSGFARILGGDAVKKDLVEDYRKKREALANVIRDGLDDDVQKTAFSNRVMIADRQFDARLYRHKSEQSVAYQDLVGEGVFKTEQANVALNYPEPGQIEMSLMRVDQEIERQARVKGITDVDVINQMKRVQGTMLHASVVEQMLMKGNDSAALAYYNGVKDQLTPEAIVTMGNKIQQANIEGEAIRTTDTVWGMFGPKTPNDPIKLEEMETQIRARHHDNPTIMKAAVADLRSRAVAHKDQANELTSSRQSKVLAAYHDGATLAQLQLMPEYQQLDGEARMKMRDYVVDNGWTEQQRSRAQAAYEDGVKANQAYSSYWELSNPKILSALSEEKILSMEPVLGTKLMNELMIDKRKMTSPENIKAATIDTDLFNKVASDAGLPAYETTQTAEQKEMLGRLKNEVEAAIDMAQRGGTVMGRTEKEELMQKMVDKKVMHSNRWTSDKEMPAATVRPDDRINVYVPMEQIDKEWMKGAMNYIRSTEPGAANWTDAEIKRGMKGRLERGYGASISNGSAEEVRKTLEGKDKGGRQ